MRKWQSKSGRLFVYEADQPIDFWRGWLDISQVVQSIKEDGGGNIDYQELIMLMVDAFDGASKIDWEGDIREGPYFSVMPTNEDFCPFIVAWKQNNNGQTFLGARVPIYSLEMTAVQAECNP